ncbi:hypothetical protein TNCV_4562221 [Trichonephila clavipes]|nr:hypothetical protein TNCV_4562221 [Trichonephila clavipes]
MDDNATCHLTLAVQDCLDSECIQRLVWPARSPDLNPIENVWDALGRQVAGRNYPPTNKNTLIRALTEEWDKLPQQLLDNVVQSMVRRVECCITLHGGHIPLRCLLTFRCIVPFLRESHFAAQYLMHTNSTWYDYQHTPRKLKTQNKFIQSVRERRLDMDIPFPLEIKIKLTNPLDRFKLNVMLCLGQEIMKRGTLSTVLHPLAVEKIVPQA